MDLAAILTVVLAVVIFLVILRRERPRRSYERRPSEPQWIKHEPQSFVVSAKPGVEVFIDDDGYRIRVVKMREHRYLAEQCLGRMLASNEVVHHINGGRADNRPENLCVLDRMKHKQFHAWLRWKRDNQGFYPQYSELYDVLLKEYGGIVLSDVEEQKY